MPMEIFMTIFRFAVAMALACTFAAPAAAKCSDDIKMLQDKAKGSDAQSKPGSQNENTPSAAPVQGGGGTSASAKILEAQAHDQRGDEANCMKAIEEAKATIK